MTIRWTGRASTDTTANLIDLLLGCLNRFDDALCHIEASFDSSSNGSVPTAEAVSTHLAAKILVGPGDLLLVSGAIVSPHALRSCAFDIWFCIDAAQSSAAFFVRSLAIGRVAGRSFPSVRVGLTTKSITAVDFVSQLRLLDLKHALDPSSSITISVGPDVPYHNIEPEETSYLEYQAPTAMNPRELAALIVWHSIPLLNLPPQQHITPTLSIGVRDSSWNCVGVHVPDIIEDLENELSSQLTNLFPSSIQMSVTLHRVVFDVAQLNSIPIRIVLPSSPHGQLPANVRDRGVPIILHIDGEVDTKQQQNGIVLLDNEPLASSSLNVQEYESLEQVDGVILQDYWKVVVALSAPANIPRVFGATKPCHVEGKRLLPSFDSRVWHSDGEPKHAMRSFDAWLRAAPISSSLRRCMQSESVIRVLACDPRYHEGAMAVGGVLQFHFILDPQAFACPVELDRRLSDAYDMYTEILMVIDESTDAQYLSSMTLLTQCLRHAVIVAHPGSFEALTNRCREFGWSVAGVLPPRPALAQPVACYQLSSVGLHANTSMPIPRGFGLLDLLNVDTTIDSHQAACAFVRGGPLQAEILDYLAPRAQASHISQLLQQQLQLALRTGGVVPLTLGQLSPLSGATTIAWQALRDTQSQLSIAILRRTIADDECSIDALSTYLCWQWQERRAATIVFFDRNHTSKWDALLNVAAPVVLLRIVSSPFHRCDYQLDPLILKQDVPRVSTTLCALSNSSLSQPRSAGSKIPPMDRHMIHQILSNIFASDNVAAFVQQQINLVSCPDCCHIDCEAARYRSVLKQLAFLHAYGSTHRGLRYTLVPMEFRQHFPTSSLASKAPCALLRIVHSNEGSVVTMWHTVLAFSVLESLHLPCFLPPDASGKIWPTNIAPKLAYLREMLAGIKARDAAAAQAIAFDIIFNNRGDCGFSRLVNELVTMQQPGLVEQLSAIIELGESHQLNIDHLHLLRSRVLLRASLIHDALRAIEAVQEPQASEYPCLYQRSACHVARALQNKKYRESCVPLLTQLWRMSSEQANKNQLAHVAKLGLRFAWSTEDAQLQSLWEARQAAYPLPAATVIPPELQLPPQYQ